MSELSKTNDTVLIPEAQGILVETRPGFREGLRLRAKQVFLSWWESPAFRYIHDRYSGLGSCLLYHRIAPSRSYIDSWSPYSSLSTNSTEFEVQLRYLRENFNCLSLPAAARLLKERRLPKKSIVLTFDDGYKDNLTCALPLLEKYEIPASIYITTGLVNRTVPLWWYEHEYIIRNANKIDFVWDRRRFQWNFTGRQDRYEALVALNRLF